MPKKGCGPKYSALDDDKPKMERRTQEAKNQPEYRASHVLVDWVDLN